MRDKRLFAPIPFSPYRRNDRRLTFYFLCNSGGAWKTESASFSDRRLQLLHPEPSVLSQLQTAIHEYRALKATGQRLSGQRRDDLTVVRKALGVDTVGQQPH